MTLSDHCGVDGRHFLVKILTRARLAEGLEIFARKVGNIGGKEKVAEVKVGNNKEIPAGAVQ